jgi:hypothetical protein
MKEKSENETIDMNQHINSKYTFVCTNEGIRISMINSGLPDLQFGSELISYDDKRIKGLMMSIESIESKIHEGSLIFYASEIMFESAITKMPEINNNEKQIVLGDEEKDWTLKRELLTIPAEWLVENGFIKKEDMPIYDASASQGRGKLYLLNEEPKHSDETDFISSKKLADGIYLFKNYSGPNCKRNGEYLMRKFAPDVKFSILGYSEV